jgi:hypothetical protein
MKDLAIVRIDNPSSLIDKVGEAILVTTTLHNRNYLAAFTDANISVLVTNSQGMQMSKVTETKTVEILSTTSHSFTSSYTVPNDTIYYLTVYTDRYDNYPNNDTITIKRYTETIGIKTISGTDGFTLSQNIPNPANNSTRIDYSVPEAGEVVFHVHSISGQLLYSKTIEASRGINSIELNTSTFAAGVYSYSMEYKGQRLVRQLIINN